MNEGPQKSSAQAVRYLLVGCFNTLFGYVVFAILNWSLRRLGSYSYMYAAILSNFMAISEAFLAYKWFVFKTKGNYLVEWIRCFAVYGVSALIGLAGLPVLVSVLRPRLANPDLASYISAALIVCVTVAFSFIGHKKISFRQKVG